MRVRFNGGIEHSEEEEDGIGGRAREDEGADHDVESLRVGLAHLLEKLEGVIHGAGEEKSRAFE